ncbi:MAG TPA: hypothetical protein VJ986_12795, partial [Gaiellaceae bacterium]|nr:hypothetical protein [Gaiellaceae bacterium]
SLVVSELERAGIDPAAAPDIALADPGPLGLHSLELTADAVISTNGRSSRSRLVVPPDPKALRALVPIAEEAA